MICFKYPLYWMIQTSSKHRRFFPVKHPPQAWGLHSFPHRGSLHSAVDAAGVQHRWEDHGIFPWKSRGSSEVNPLMSTLDESVGLFGDRVGVSSTIVALPCGFQYLGMIKVAGPDSQAGQRRKSPQWAWLSQWCLERNIPPEHANMGLQQQAFDLRRDEATWARHNQNCPELHGTNIQYPAMVVVFWGFSWTKRSGW